MRHLIVGGGPAGMNAIETIRELDAEAEIHLVCDEPAYARMALPYLLEGRIEERAVMTADSAWFDEQRVDTRLGQRVTSLDLGSRALSLDDGSELTWDRLLLATGSRTRRPDVPGIDGAGIFNLWTLDDAHAYLAESHGETVIIGAGFIAFTVLDALASRSDRVRFIELESQILPNMLDAPAARQLETHLADRGIEVRTSARLERIEQIGGRRRLQLADGDTLDCDAVILATGVQPNIELAREAGIEIGEGPGAGILADDHLCTSASHVYTAGDCAQAGQLLDDSPRVQAIQPTAVDHGRVAGANMAGENVSYSGALVMNILAAQGLEACSFGRWNDSSGEATVVENAGNHIYRKYVWRGDQIVGGVLVGPTAAVTGANDVGMLKGLIQSEVHLGSWKDYLAENPLDLRRPYVASGAAKRLLESTLIAGRADIVGGFRFPSLRARRDRSPHHGALISGKP